MTPAFLAALALTVAALVAVIWSGATRRKNAHYGAIVAMLGLLGWAIYEAETIGASLVFEGAAGVLHKVHFVAVTVVFLLVPLLATSGIKLARGNDPLVRTRHRKRAYAFVVAVLLTCGLGTAMTMMATPKAEVGASAAEGALEPGAGQGADVDAAQG